MYIVQALPGQVEKIISEMRQFNVDGAPRLRRTCSTPQLLILQVTTRWYDEYGRSDETGSTVSGKTWHNSR